MSYLSYEYKAKIYYSLAVFRSSSPLTFRPKISVLRNSSVVGKRDVSVNFFISIALIFHNSEDKTMLCEWCPIQIDRTVCVFKKRKSKLVLFLWHVRKDPSLKSLFNDVGMVKVNQI